ncbi:hypothetical protein MUK42_35489 [Musa troglodytarum]|uniref:Uncharacterized protein n=1 Tax=Musa troglodytarum TaxID=320322 RepID=A0A9E7KKW8_9LILI|nr:hypothetical protein MUK42_35489 [Musa troglodytarum]
MVGVLEAVVGFLQAQAEQTRTAPWLDLAPCAAGHRIRFYTDVLTWGVSCFPQWLSQERAEL